jgi:hypothetical protein
MISFLSKIAKKWSEILWDLWCVISIVGIWPRYIEPNLLRTTKLTLKITGLPKALQGFRILQFSDLHHPYYTEKNGKKLQQTIKEIAPDLIVFTGDFISYGKLDDADRLKRVLMPMEAPYGCFAILGNHDFSQCVSINDQGDYDIIERTGSVLSKGFKRLFTTTTLTKKITERARNLPMHDELLKLIKDTPFQLLNNRTMQVDVAGTRLNVCGLGEYMIGQSLPDLAFKEYDKRYPGIILLHNPDGIPLLKGFPGDVVLCGHTHGGQINLPLIWKKFTVMENISLKKGLHKVDNKWAYVNRGVGGVFKFRWFSAPELLVLTLEADI